VSIFIYEIASMKLKASIVEIDIDLKFSF